MTPTTLTQQTAPVATSTTSTITDRARYQDDERALLTENGIDLDDEPRCRECGCTDSLACPQGCGSVQPDLCSACASELDELADPLAVPDPERDAA